MVYQAIYTRVYTYCTTPGIHLLYHPGYTSHSVHHLGYTSHSVHHLGYTTMVTPVPPWVYHHGNTCTTLGIPLFSAHNEARSIPVLSP